MRLGTGIREREGKGEELFLGRGVVWLMFCAVVCGW